MSTVPSGPGVRSLKRAQVRVITVFFMIYILVSGGSFGIEIYVWARRALGDFWGFQTAWWWSLSLFVDSSVYIVLAVGYLQNWLGFGQLWFYVICWAIIAISADGLFPRSISRVSRRFGTPIAAILLMAALNAVLIVGPFRNLVVIDVILFISAYVLIFISAVVLRTKEPDLKRPFRVPLSTAGMAAMVVPPILIVLFTVYVNAIDRSTEVFGFTGFRLLGVDVGWYGIAGFAALFSGPVLYYAFRALCGGPGDSSREAGNAALAFAEAEAAADAA